VLRWALHSATTTEALAVGPCCRRSMACPTAPRSPGGPLCCCLMPQSPTLPPRPRLSHHRLSWPLLWRA